MLLTFPSETPSDYQYPLLTVPMIQSLGATESDCKRLAVEWARRCLFMFRRMSWRIGPCLACRSGNPRLRSWALRDAHSIHNLYQWPWKQARHAGWAAGGACHRDGFTALQIAGYHAAFAWGAEAVYQESGQHRGLAFDVMTDEAVGKAHWRGYTAERQRQIHELMQAAGITGAIVNVRG